MSDLAVHETGIPGLLSVQLVVNRDERGWFKENYQRAKLEALGLPPFDPVQNNVSFNLDCGVTRGIHAEPWNKYISVATGSVFAAIVDFRQGSTFGRVETFRLTPEQAIFVPLGCGNSFQTLAPNTAYAYLVDAHWSAAAEYVLVNLFDPELAIPWPIPRAQAIVSEKDDGHPPLSDITPMEVS